MLSRIHDKTQHDTPLIMPMIDARPVIHRSLTLRRARNETPQVAALSGNPRAAHSVIAARPIPKAAGITVSEWPEDLGMPIGAGSLPPCREYTQKSSEHTALYG